MSEATFKVIHAGPLVTYQDSGRSGFAKFGVTKSGPMDRLSHSIANIALRNSVSATAIEISVGGLTLECVSGDLTFAVAGGGFAITLDGTKLAPWHAARIVAGQKLVIQRGTWGSWAYLAFSGRISTKQWLGSAATHSMAGFGGGNLKTGDQIVVQGAERREEREGDIPSPESNGSTNAIEIVLGPQDRFFNEECIEHLKTQTFELTNAYDRMGVRLKGPPLVPSSSLDMPSEPIVRGSIQVSGDGVATILAADHQTTGGYPKVATVVSDEVDRFVQFRPGDSITFKVISPEEALGRVRNRYKAYLQYIEGIAKGHGTLMQRLLSENLISGVIGPDSEDD